MRQNWNQSISVTLDVSNKVDKIRKRRMRDGSFDPSLLDGIHTRRHKGRRIIPRGAVVEMLCRDILEEKR